MLNILNYTDYRKYLSDYYEARKKMSTFFSYRYFCQKAGIKSTALYKEVVEGTRNLTDSTIPQFIKGLGLTGTDAGYFEALVNFNQADTDIAKQKYLNEMRNQLPQIEEKVLPIEMSGYYSNWHNVAIRELACVLDWKEDYELLAASVAPAIKVREAKAAVKLLLHLNLLKRDSNGRYTQTFPHQTTQQEVISVAVRALNTQLAELGKNSIQDTPPSERDVSSLTMGLTERSFKLVKQEILLFKDRIKRIVSEESESDRVYNVNIQLFPMSIKSKGESKGALV
ncbi:MAG: TIGR02147 family protein [Fibrobacteres bacterium]|nr:TIGR02147 family protein [Fibrobacterota bacterium]